MCYIRETTITSKHIWHLDIPKCVYLLTDDALQTTDRHFLFFSESYLYMVHLGLRLFSGSRKNSENI